MNSVFHCVYLDVSTYNMLLVLLVMKRQGTVWEKILANTIPDKELYSEYKKKSQISLIK